jgi:hypothetical protein
MRASWRVRLLDFVKFYLCSVYVYAYKSAFYRESGDWGGGIFAQCCEVRKCSDIRKIGRGDYLCTFLIRSSDPEIIPSPGFGGG